MSDSAAPYQELSSSLPFSNDTKLSNQTSNPTNIALHAVPPPRGAYRSAVPPTQPPTKGPCYHITHLKCTIPIAWTLDAYPCLSINRYRTVLYSSLLSALIRTTYYAAVRGVINQYRYQKLKHRRVKIPSTSCLPSSNVSSPISLPLSWHHEVK